MSRSLTRRDALTGGAVAVLAGLAGCSGMTPFVGKQIENSRTIDPSGIDDLVVDLDGGDVSLQAAERQDLAIEYVKKSSSVRVDLSKLHFRTTRSGGTLSLHSEWNGGDNPFGGRPQLALDAIVPTKLSVSRIETVVGDVTVTGTAGDITLETETGDLVVTGVKGTVSANTNTGDVEVTDPDAIGDLRTNTGDVEADVPAMEGPTRVDTETGDATVSVASDLDADLVARTETGEVTIDGISLSDPERTGDVVGSKVSGLLGDGGPRLLVETETGDVTVRSLE
jgi:DUF4097 and DUF4098 domain-containing protein YvlB